MGQWQRFFYVHWYDTERNLRQRPRREQVAELCGHCLIVGHLRSQDGLLDGQKEPVPRLQG